jgi:hypothetical protein
VRRSVITIMLAACALVLSGCPTASNEPPPPPRKAEIPVAPPRALGALAAGTDAAPRPDMTPPVTEPDPEAPLVPPAVPAPAAPAPAPAPAPDDSAAPSEKPAPPALAPDAGMAL